MGYDVEQVLVRSLRLFTGLLVCLAAMAADAPLLPVTVCELIGNPEQYDGKAVAVVGKFSFRESAGRYIGEASCRKKLLSGTAEWPSTFRVVFDPRGAPKPPDVFAVSSGLLNRKLEELKERTPMGKFRFGSLDYDRWAVVYGRLEFRRDLHTVTITPAVGKTAGLEPSPAQVICSGEAAVMFIPDE
jgi:hypothetical protein